MKITTCAKCNEYKYIEQDGLCPSCFYVSLKIFDSRSNIDEYKGMREDFEYRINKEPEFELVEGSPDYTINLMDDQVLVMEGTNPFTSVLYRNFRDNILIVNQTLGRIYKMNLHT